MLHQRTDHTLTSRCTLTSLTVPVNPAASLTGLIFSHRNLRLNDTIQNLHCHCAQMQNLLNIQVAYGVTHHLFWRVMHALSVIMLHGLLGSNQKSVCRRSRSRVSS